jgi:Acetyltransferase (GNAT) domain
MAGCESGRPAFPEFATPRLESRKLRASDEDFLARMDSDPAVMRHIHSGPLSYQEALAYARFQIELAQYRRHWGKLVIAVRESGLCAGWVELSTLSGPCRDDLQVGYEPPEPRLRARGSSSSSIHRCRSNSNCAFRRPRGGSRSWSSSR